MTEWERGREQEEFFRAAMFYKSSNSTLASRFTRAKYEDDADQVEVPRDQEVRAVYVVEFIGDTVTALSLTLKILKTPLWI